jgi:hypothetical protein
MSGFNAKKIKIDAKTVAFVGVMAATLECGKLVLSFLPNIEIVTILCALFGYVFGWLGVIAAVVFVCVEPLIYGFGGWIITYIIYWPLVAFIFMLLNRLGIKNRWLLTAVAVGLTLFFGILSSVVDTAFLLGVNKFYFKNLIIYYLRGLIFYIVQIVCNATLFPLLFPFLAEKLKVIKSLP